jgi:hypothetical protein
MNTFEFLFQGILVAMQPMNLLYAFVGVTLGTAVGVLPGIGPALTVALLLPVTYQLDPAGSLIMFAGIYYGGMYGGSTTSILLNTPGESASIVTALEGNKMARAGRGGPALATAAIGSFVAGLIATLGLAFIAPFIVKLALVFGPREYFALMVLAFVTVSSAFGDSALRGLTSCSSALRWPGRHRPADRSGAAFLRHSRPARRRRGDDAGGRLFAIGETLYIAAQGNSIEEKIEAVKGSLWMTAEDWALVEAVAARHADRLPDRRDAGGRRRDRHVPLLFHRKAAGEEPGRVRPWRHRGCRRSRGCQQCVGCRYAGAAADARPADLGDGGDHAGRLPAIRAAARPAAVCQQSAAGLGADRQPLDRQRRCCWCSTCR